MATFTINVLANDNNPPNRIGNNDIEVPYQESYIFSKEDFTTNTIPTYQDPEGDDLHSIKILQLVDNLNYLNFKNNPLEIGDIITAQDLENGNFIFLENNEPEGNTSVSFVFDASDEGSLQFAGLKGLIRIIFQPKINQPPSQVGDGEKTVTETEVSIFTRKMFTDTIPEFQDPENDPAFLLKITSLPTLGTIRYNNVPIAVNQIITFADIDNGLLTYTSNLLGENSLDEFSFQIADEGSLTFVG